MSHENVDLRRQLIFRRVVLDNHPLPLKDLKRLLQIKQYDHDTATRDIDAFRAVGCELELQPCQTDKDDHELVFLEGPHLDNDATRERIHGAEKKIVAAMAASLIYGIGRDKEMLPPW